VEAELIGRPATTWRVTTLAKSVELQHCPINTRPTGGSRHTHTPYFADSTYKDLILSVVAKRSLVGRVARL
jgi:hypothetical protein